MIQCLKMSNCGTDDGEDCKILEENIPQALAEEDGKVEPPEKKAKASNV